MGIDDGVAQSEHETARGQRLSANSDTLPGVDVRIVESAEAFDLPEWRELARLDPHGNIFFTPEWNRLWWDSFGEGKRLVVVTFVDPEPVGLAALMIDDTDEGRRIRFLGGDDLTDYLGPLVAAPDHQGPVAEALLNYLSKDLDDWSYFDAKCLPVPFGFSEWFVEAADRLGMTFSVEMTEMTAVLPLPPTFDDYLAGLTQKQRHELRRKTRRFEREVPGAALRTATGDSLHSDLETFVEMHRKSEGPKGEFMRPERASFFEKVTAEFGPRNVLFLDFLELGAGGVAAAMFSFEFDGVFYLYNSAFDQALAAFSPGVVMVAKLIERSIQKGLTRFDFLRGRERYKFDLGAQALPLHSVMIKRSG